MPTTCVIRCVGLWTTLVGITILACSAPGLGAQEGLVLPDGVTHVALPPGELRMENVVRNGKPLLRLTVGKTVIETRTIFLGNGKGATHYEAIKEGMHWVPPEGGKGFVVDGVQTFEPGNTIGEPSPNFIRVQNLKPGSIYITTQSIKFEFGPGAKAKPKP